jgi:predicted membrane protein
MTMATNSTPLVPARLVLGLVVLLLGLVFLADGAGLLSADSALALWPVGLVALGLVVVWQPDIGNRFVGAVLLIAGVWLLLNTVGVWSYRFWHTWPYLLVAFGAWMIYRVRGMREREGPDGRVSGSHGRFDRPTTDADYVAGFAFLDRVTRQATSARFQSGEVTAVFGTCAIDLSRVTAAEQNGRTVIDTFALFGRIQLDVPAGWNVENRVLPLLGRADMPQPSVANGPTVVIQGPAIGGSVSVAAAR